MTTPETFAPPEGLVGSRPDFAAVIDAVRGPLLADAASETGRSLTVRDTADRRLARVGQWLTCDTATGGREAWQLTTAAGAPVCAATVPSPAPEFADELPGGDLRDHLEDLSRGRSLRPLGEIRIVETVAPLRDDEGKIRCRLVLATITGPTGITRSELGVRALKGYEGDARRLRARIVETLGWPVQDVPATAQVLAAMTVVPPLAGSSIRADDPAGSAMREILSGLLDVLEDRLPGVIADRDPVYLHQFRVAIRRTRSALSQLSGAIALEGRVEAVDGFRWLGQVTSPCRDLDVQLLDLVERRRQADVDGAALDVLERHLTGLKTATHQDLVLALSGARFRTLVNHWRASLDPSSANWTATEPLRAPFAAIVSARGARLLRKVLREGGRIGPDSEAERLHDLRKRMKKLRYVTEFLGEALPRERMRPAVKALKGLQDVLGRVQDREVQVDALRGYGHALAGRKGETIDALMAIGAWSEELDRDRRAARAAFADAFERFTAKETQAIFRGIFAAGMGEN